MTVPTLRDRSSAVPPTQGRTARNFVTRRPHGQLPCTSGTYVLLLHLSRSASIRVGRLGIVTFRRGYYAYVGSAFGPGGLAARVERHVRTGVRTHWHIDYLREIAQPVGVWFSAEGVRREHEWAKVLLCAPSANNAVPRFGASDCRCASHLLYLEHRAPKRWLTRRLRRQASLRYFSLATATPVAWRGGGRVR
jgi:Uri superfamily endonuclease